MPTLKYVMNETEQKLYEMIKQDGIKAPLNTLIRAYVEFGHYGSDMGLREKAHAAFDVADILKDILTTIDE